MSNVAIFAESSIPPEGRRTKVRQPLGSLAYLDIIPDNGGIILNLSEDGLAFQAVAPLHDQKQVQLVVQLPHSGTRFETAAEVVWLGSSTRQAGVRFLNVSADVRLQIREWIESQSQGAPKPGEVGSTDLAPVRAANGDEAASPSLQDGATSGSPQQEWLSLMSEFEGKFKQQEQEPLAEPEEKPENVLESVSPAAPGAPILSPRPEILPWPSALVSSHEPPARTAPISSPEFPGARSTGEFAREGPGLRQVELEEAGREPQYPSSSSPKRREEATPHGSSTESARVKKAHSGLSALESDFPLLRAVVVQGSPQAKDDDVKPGLPVRKRDSLRNQVALVVVFALFAVLCFGIGTWVGHLPSGETGQQDAATVSTPPPSKAPAAEQAIQASSPANGGSGAANKTERERTPERSNGIDAARLRTGTTFTVPTIAQPELQSSAIPPMQQFAPALKATAPPALSSSDQHVSTPPQNKGTAQLSPVDLSPEDSTPQVVDGYVLRPSDRFNPCHLMYRVDPVYPTQARQQGIEGSVRIHLVIASDGSVQSEKLISGPAQLAPAALEATQYWRYLPALLNGQPVPTEKDVEIAFHLPPH